MNRMQVAVERIGAMIRAGGKNGAIDTPEKVAAFEEKQSITFEEHFAYQNAQARAHAMGKITTDEARIIYSALGEAYHASNGGWKSGTTLAEKVAVTMAMASIL